MIRIARTTRLLILAGALGFSSFNWAQQSADSPSPRAPAANGQSGGQEPPRHGPPAEALAACKALASGAACSFTSPRGAESGTCFAPEGKPLACRPARARPGEGPGEQPRPKPAP